MVGSHCAKVTESHKITPSLSWQHMAKPKDFLYRLTAKLARYLLRLLCTLSATPGLPIFVAFTDGLKNPSSSLLDQILYAIIHMYLV